MRDLDKRQITSQIRQTMAEVFGRNGVPYAEAAAVMHIPTTTLYALGRDSEGVNPLQYLGLLMRVPEFNERYQMMFHGCVVVEQAREEVGHDCEQRAVLGAMEEVPELARNITGTICHTKRHRIAQAAKRILSHLAPVAFLRRKKMAAAVFVRGVEA